MGWVRNNRGKVFFALLLLLGLLYVAVSSFSEPVEMHDFTQEEVNEMVMEVLEKENIPLVKNIGVLQLPAMRSVVKDGATYRGTPAMLDFNSLEECGKKCQELIDNGYVDIFIDGSQSYYSGNESDADATYLEYSRKIFVDYYDIDIENNPKYINESSGCKLNLLSEEYRLIICTNMKKFNHAVIYRFATFAQRNELQYRSSPALGAAKITIEGRVTWFELYNWKEKNNAYSK